MRFVSVLGHVDSEYVPGASYGMDLDGPKPPVRELTYHPVPDIA